MEEKNEPNDFDKLKKKINIFNEIGKTLTSSLTIKEVLEKILGKVAEYFSPENWSLLLVDEEKQELYFEIIVGEVADKIKDIRLKVGEGVAGWVAKTGRPLIVPSVKNEPLFNKKIDEMTQFETESIICIPLRIRDKVIGVIELINKRDLSPLHQYDIEVLSTVADYAAIALENARNFEQVEKLTITDDVTELYNSRYLHTILQDETEKAVRQGKNLSIIFFDIDRFKKINDTHGHLFGSRLLGKVGKLVASHLKEGFSAARYGGDEYVVILPDTDKKSAVTFCKTLQKSLNTEKFFLEEGLDVTLTASFGIASFPEDARGKDKLLQIADERMYKVKDRSKNGIEHSG